MEGLKIVNGDLVVSGDDFAMIGGVDELAQCCEDELGTNKGEWFLDPDKGIRFESFNTKNPDENDMADEIREGLFRTGRIDSVEDVTFKQDKIKRTQRVEFIATTTAGDRLATGVDVNA